VSSKITLTIAAASRGPTAPVSDSVISFLMSLMDIITTKIAKILDFRLIFMWHLSVEIGNFVEKFEL
jgi:hypothetical protein